MNYQQIMLNSMDEVFDLENKTLFKKYYNLEQLGLNLDKVFVNEKQKMFYLKWLERYKQALYDYLITIDYYNINYTRSR